MIEVRYDQGLYFPELDLWMDPRFEKPTAFVSHAHSDHMAQHREVILSTFTARLMSARLAGQRIEHALEYHQPFLFKDARIVLYPAGHILGSAQLYLEHSHDSLLYTGDFKLRPGESAEPIEWTQADTLIMETTYGLPKYVFPPTHEVVRQVANFCSESIEEGYVPILFGYSLGKAQEILAALHDTGFRIMLHPSVFSMTQVYQELRQRLPLFFPFSAETLNGSVLICPPTANRTRFVQSIKKRRTAILTGWALDPGAAFRYQCDVAFPLSDHADYTDLIAYVELVRPKRVLTLHGFAQEFAADLRRRGIDAWAIGSGNQLELEIQPSEPTLRKPAKQPFLSNSGFTRFANLCESIGEANGKLKKVEILANYLKSIDADELEIVIRYLGSSLRSETGAMQVGWAVIRRAVMQAGELSEAEFRRISRGYGDPGRLTFEALLGRTNEIPTSIFEVEAAFQSLRQISGPVAKADKLAELLRRSSTIGACYIIKILSGDLRIGLRQGLVEDSIAQAFNEEPESVREAHMLCGDIGQVARMARDHRLDQATLSIFQPVTSMLAISEPSAQAIYQRIDRDWTGTQIYAEAKYDGIRAQLHYTKNRVEIFSRDRRNISGEFPELTRIQLDQEVILDGEIIAFDQQRKLTFFDLQRRLGRKRVLDLFETDDVPIVYTAFDLLWLNGTSLLKQPLTYRRQRLEELSFPDQLRRSPIQPLETAQQIEDAFVEARGAGMEGLMLKDPHSFYTPGSRGGSWIKLKKEFATLDVVVVAAELGHGKRSHLLSDYTFAVRNVSKSVLQVIGKAYSGLTDLEIEELTEHFRNTTTRQSGHWHEVYPDIVLEIAFDSIQRSQRHSSGLALRFPRIKAIRRDKSVQDIDTVEYVRRLAGLPDDESEA